MKGFEICLSITRKKFLRMEGEEGFQLFPLGADPDEVDLSDLLVVYDNLVIAAICCDNKRILVVFRNKKSTVDWMAIDGTEAGNTWKGNVKRLTQDEWEYILDNFDKVLTTTNNFIRHFSAWKH